ncbi:MAG: hypothetical protein ACXAB7_09965 [Candidatus Kariarchaeaceae archaeon]|jgi:hypothetical protein
MSLYNLPNDTFNNTNLNSIGSQYAQDYGKDVSLLVQKVTNRAIFDAAPKQFFDLKLLNMKSFDTQPSDEFFYKEMGYQREPLTATGGAAAVVYPATQTFTISATDNIATDTIIVYPDNKKGTVVDIDTTTSSITVKPYSNDSLPAVAANDVFANLSSVEADGAEGWAQYFRASTIERHNFVQLFNKVIKYGEVELHKLKNAAVTNNFLQMERQAMYRQFRIDISNTFWNGDKGEVTLASGEVAKTTGGIFPAMVAAGSPNASTTLATLPDAFEDVVLNSEFGDYGDVRFAFMTPRIALALSKEYKDDKTRYRPNDMIAKLNLDEVNIGSSRVVFVPFKRFEDQASFPDSFRNRIVLADMKNINLCQLWGERSGDTLSRTDGIPKRYKEMWVDANMGVKFNNPLGCGWLDVTL